jgi:hypothetical protein
VSAPDQEFVRAPGLLGEAGMYVDEEGRVWLNGEVLSGVSILEVEKEKRVDTSGVAPDPDDWRNDNAYI